MDLIETVPDPAEIVRVLREATLYLWGAPGEPTAQRARVAEAIRGIGKIVTGFRAFVREHAEGCINDGSNGDGYCRWCGELTGGVDPTYDPHRPDCDLVRVLGGVGGRAVPVCHARPEHGSWRQCERPLPCPEHPDERWPRRP